jgi:hypothetical protein
MKQQHKIRFMTFLVAVLLALGGLVAQSHSAYAGMNPPGRPRFETVLLGPTDIMAAPHGISTSPGLPRP